VQDTWITGDAIEPAEVLRRVGSPAHGAAVLFLGTVRDHNEGKSVAGLEYEVYPAMAERVLAAIAAEAAQRWAGARIAAVHRGGTLEIGDVAVAVAVSTAHRADAFEAARHVMEEIKLRLPVWKKEAYREQAAQWLDGLTPPAPLDGGGSGG
jgi:molybdopterin synthase catalytic subunit